MQPPELLCRQFMEAVHYIELVAPADGGAREGRTRVQMKRKKEEKEEEVKVEDFFVKSSQCNKHTDGETTEQTLEMCCGMVKLGNVVSHACRCFHARFEQATKATPARAALCGWQQTQYTKISVQVTLKKV